MFVRSVIALVGVFAAAGAVAVASATATEEPPPPVPVTTPLCVDNVAPHSRLNADWRRGFRRGVLRGIAIDQGCRAGGAGRIKRVDVSISRSLGKRCQLLKPNGRLSRPTACGHLWLRARGGTRWTFRLHRRLPHGRYVIRTRAVDSAGNVEA